MKPRVDLGQLDLNLLYTFRVVVEARGVQAAGRRLGRSQPAVSARIRQLEEQLGVRLFERIGRGLALTAVGRAVDAEITTLLESVHGVLDKVRSAEEEPVGVLRVGCLPTTSVYLLPDAIARFQRAHMRATVDIQHGLTNEQLDQLRSGALDVVVSVGPKPKTGVEVVVIGEARPRAAFPVRRAPRGRTIDEELLGETGYIVFSRIGDLFFERVGKYVERAGLDAGARVRVAHIQTIQSLILAGAGTSILPDYTIGPGLVGLPIAGLTFAYPIWLAYRPTSRDAPLVRRFLEEVLRTHPKNG